MQEITSPYPSARARPCPGAFAGSCSVVSAGILIYPGYHFDFCASSPSRDGRRLPQNRPLGAWRDRRCRFGGPAPDLGHLAHGRVRGCGCGFSSCGGPDRDMIALRRRRLSASSSDRGGNPGCGSYRGVSVGGGDADPHPGDL